MSEQELPKSNALAEASPDSLSELLSRDPEDPRADRRRIIQVMIEQRERFMKAEAEGKATKAAKPKAAVSLKTPVQANTVDVGDLGL